VIDERSPTLSQFTTMWGLAFLFVVMASAMSFLSKDNGTGGVIKIRT
jgi:hypothetical protein